MSTDASAYTIERLAPGSYDVLLDGCLVAALAQGIHGWGEGSRIDLLDETLLSERPPPFTAQYHTFRSQTEALEWLGILSQQDKAGPRLREHKR